MIFNPEIIYPDFIITPHKSSAMRLLELAIGFSVKDGCMNSGSILKWLEDISEAKFLEMWSEIFPDLISKEYFDQAHGGCERFISSRGTIS